MERKRIAITMGDPGGIGPEIVVKALTERSVYERCIPVVIGDYEALKDAVRFSGISSVLREIQSMEEAVGEFGQIEYINLYTESDSDSDIVITDMTFEDEGEQYTPEHLLPYVISMEG